MPIRADVLEDGRAIPHQMFIVNDSAGTAGQYLAESLLSLEKWLVTQILAVKFDQVEGGQRNSCVRPPTRSASKTDKPLGRQTIASSPIRKDLARKHLAASTIAGKQSDQSKPFG